MTELELIHEHYLKRELLRLQIDSEVDELADFKSIGQLGLPFENRDKSKDKKNFPILYHMFRECVATFPFISGVNETKFWRDTVQVFLEDFGQKEISTSIDREEETKRYRMGVKLKKMIQLYTAAGIKTTTNEHETKIERVSERGMQTPTVEKLDKFINGYDINVKGVRIVSSKRSFFSSVVGGSDSHAEFFVHTESDAFASTPGVTVVRTYSDFKHLDKKLHKEFPGKPLPRIPSKNKSDSTLDANGNAALATDDKDVDRDDDDDEEEEEDEDENVTDIGESKLEKKSKIRFGRKTKAPKQRLKRERQRTSLRGYLKQLVEIPQVARSQTFLEFLFRDQVRKFSDDELKDFDQRSKMDKIRISHQIRFFEIATARAKTLEGFLADFRQELVAKNGIERLFAEIKHKKTIQELSPKFQKFVDWAVIEFAATLYHMFVANDTSPEFFSQIRRIHALLPYTVLKTILKYSNPVAMIKGVTDLFLAQPFGKRSLLQNIFWIVLGDDIKAQDRLLTELRDKIAHPDLTRVIDGYVASDGETKAAIRAYAQDNDSDLVVGIFENASLFSTSVHSGIVQLVLLWHAKWKDNSVDDTKSFDMYSQLREYLKLAIRKRDKDKMQEFWADDSTIKMIKELVTVFYTPLIRVFKLANVHESVGDFEVFMDDLIKVVNRAELDAASSDPNQMVESFIALCTRHQASVYKFIHQIYEKDDGLFGGLIAWISGIIEFLRGGTKNKMDLQGLFARARNDPNIDCDLIIKEMDDIIQWIKDRREWRDTKASKVKVLENDWSQAMPQGGGIEGSDFGLDNDELEDFQAEEFDLDLEKDLEGLKPPAKPSIAETVKLLPMFETELVSVMAMQ